MGKGGGAEEDWKEREGGKGVESQALVSSQLGTLRQAWQGAARAPASCCRAPADGQGRLSVQRLRTYGRDVGHISRADPAKGRASPRSWQSWVW